MSQQFILPFDPSALSSITTAQLKALIEEAIPITSYGWIWHSSIEPPVPSAFQQRCIWYDSVAKKLKRYDSATGHFVTIDIDITIADNTLPAEKLKITGATYRQVLAVGFTEAEWATITDLITAGSLTVDKLINTGASKVLITDALGVNTWQDVSAFVSSISSMLPPPGNRSIMADYMNWVANLFGTTTGTTTDYVLTLTPNPASPVFTIGNGSSTSMIFWCKFHATNTGAATLMVNGSKKTLKKNGTQDLIAGDVAANTIHLVAYDGTNFQVLSPLVPSFKRWVEQDLGPVAFASKVSGTFAHTLGVMPSVVQGYYRKVASGGSDTFAVGDRLLAESVFIDAAASGDLWSPSVAIYIPTGAPSITTVGYCFGYQTGGYQLRTIDTSASTYINLLAADWELSIKVGAFI